MDIYEYFSRLLRLLLLTAAVLLLVWGLPPADDRASEPTLAVDSSMRGSGRDGDFARLTVVTKDEISLEQAWLLINGQVAGSLAGGRLSVRVYDGDELAIDCRAYGRALTFYLEELSANIQSKYLQLEVDCKDKIVPLGFVVIQQL